MIYLIPDLIYLTASKKVYHSLNIERVAAVLELHIHYSLFPLSIIQIPLLCSHISQLFASDNISPSRCGNRSGLWPPTSVELNEKSSGRWLDIMYRTLYLMALKRSPGIQMLDIHAPVADIFLRKENVFVVKEILGAEHRCFRICEYLNFFLASPPPPPR